MFRINPQTQPPIEYSMMVEPRPAGPTIGLYRGLPIAERVVDQFGRRFLYVGLASRRRDGRFDVASLRAGEFIAEPGLVYRLEANERASRKAA
jgi:hypothetical protein